jgi:zinc transporter 2
MLPSYQKQNNDSDHSHDHQHHADTELGHKHKDYGNQNHDHAHDHGHHERNGSTCSHDKLEIHTDEVPPDDIPQPYKRNVNLHAAYLHVMADLAQSVAVLIAGLVIWARPDWHMIDPILTLLFAVLVLYSTLGVLRSSISVLLEATPPNISWRKVYAAISNVPNVHNVHDLHLWSISHGQPSLSVHCQSNDPEALFKIRDQCEAFGITHATIQVQREEGPCATCRNTSYCTTHLA